MKNHEQCIFLFFQQKKYLYIYTFNIMSAAISKPNIDLKKEDSNHYQTYFKIFLAGYLTGLYSKDDLEHNLIQLYNKLPIDQDTKLYYVKLIKNLGQSNIEWTKNIFKTFSRSSNSPNNSAPPQQIGSGDDYELRMAREDYLRLNRHESSAEEQSFLPSNSFGINSETPPLN